MHLAAFWVFAFPPLGGFTPIKRLRSALLWITLPSLFSGLFCGAAVAMGPENVIVVVNSSSADSLAVANHYIELRNIPPSNVIYVPKVTVLKQSDTQSAQSWRFKREVLDPIWQTIEKRGLEDQVQCIAYSAGFPSRLVFQAELKKHLLATGQKKNKTWKVPWGSTTGITYFREKAIVNDTYMLSPNANWYAIDRVRNLWENPFVGESAKSFDSAVTQFNTGNYKAAAQLLASLAQEHPDQVIARYPLVRALALSGQPDEAIEQLKICSKSGWSYRALTQKDPALESLRKHPDYAKVVETIQDLPVGLLPGKRFSSSQWWSKNGWPNNSKQQGRRYVMSVMLAVVRPTGSTRSQAIKQLERSVPADGTHPKGTFFFAKHKDVRSRVRQPQIAQTAARLKTKGFDVEVSDQKWPKDKINILGASLGSAKIDWTTSRSNLVPGCLMDNLTSAGAAWPAPTQTQLTAHLNAGSTGATGTVVEPLAIPAKFPTTRIHEHSVDGFSMAESIYQTVLSPFQLLVVGDPLCSPFGKFPEFELITSTNLQNVRKQFHVEIKLKTNSPPAKRFDLFTDGKFTAKLVELNGFSFDPSGLSDGYHELRVVGISATQAANQTSKTLEIVVNRSGGMTTAMATQSRIRLNQVLKLEVNCSASEEVEIWNNYRVLAKVRSGSTASVDTRSLGIGKTKLTAAGITGDGRTVRSRPVVIEVVR